MSTAYSAASVIIPAQGGGGKAGTLYGWRPDVNQLQDIDVLRNTTASRVNEAGLIEFVGVNVPRFDWGEGGSCPSLLVEPERTNLLTYSEEFDNAVWVKNPTGINTAIGTDGIEPNVATAPDGTMTADRVNFIPNASVAGISRILSAAAGSTHVSSIFVKGEGADIGKTISINMRRQTGGYIETNIQATLTAEWQRIATPPLIFIDQTGLDIRFFSNSTQNGATTALIWGAQIEEGSYPTSYIKTVASQETRNADVISKTGISSLIGQQEGVVYWEGILPQIGDGGAAARNNIFNTEREPSTRTGWSITHRADTETMFVDFFIGDGTFSPIIALSSVGFAAGSFAKIAFAYKSGSSALFVNGALRASATTTFTSVTTMNQITLGDSVVVYGFPAPQFVSSAALYKTRLTNDELAALTTL